MGLGLAALGRPGYINLGHGDDLAGSTGVEPLKARSHEVLDAAYVAGIRYFDAARSYGKAEEFLADWLRRRGSAKGELTIGSKWGYAYTADWRVDAPVHEVKEHSARRLREQWAETRALLGDSLGLYQIHSATEESGVLDRVEVLEELARLRDRGLAIGLTVTGPRQAETIRRALEIEAGGKPLFTAVQATWNLLEPSAGPALREAKARGAGVIVKEPLANGRLTDRNRERQAVLDDVAARHGAPLDAIALAAALAQPFADVVLSGAATVEQLRSNVRALELDMRGEVDAIVAETAEDPERYWQNRSRMSWN